MRMSTPALLPWRFMVHRFDTLSLQVFEREATIPENAVSAKWVRFLMHDNDNRLIYYGTTILADIGSMTGFRT
jgi:hypothetical protein